MQIWPAVQCCFNSASDPFNGQAPNSISKPPKVIESRIEESQSGELLKRHCYTAGQVCLDIKTKAIIETLVTLYF